MIRTSLLLLSIVLPLLANACSSLNSTLHPLHAEGRDHGYVLLERPVTLPQGKVMYDCGPEALTCLLAYWGHETSVEEASRVLFNPRLKGTLSFDLAPYARTKGLATRYDNGSVGKIREAIHKQIPPIVMIDASGMFPLVGGRIYHFFVVVGYNDHEKVIVCESYDPEKKYLIDYDELERRWSATKFFHLEIYPATAYDSFRNARDLEAQGYSEQAQKLYLQAIEKDPEYQPAHLGLGNTYFLGGDSRQARHHYERAFQLDPYDPVAMNNLAHVYMELGENLADAEVLCKKALAWYRSRLKFVESKLQMEDWDESTRQDLQREWKTIRREYALALGTLGQTEAAQKKTIEAIASWELALAVTPETEKEVRARRCYELGRAYREKGMTEKSGDYLRQASGLTGDPELKSAIEQLQKH